MDNFLLLPTLGVLALAYFLGSVPYGLLIATNFCNVDPRAAGSGNVGATNVARLCGKLWGALTLLCDLAKGALAVGIAWYAAEQWQAWHYSHLAAGFLAIVGHIYPVFLKFKGGKGVATTVGVFLVLCPIPFILAAIICLFIIWRTGFVSAGSLALVICIPIFTAVSKQFPVAIVASVIALLIIYAHRQNIQRLLKGEEKTWNVKRSHGS